MKLSDLKVGETAVVEKFNCSARMERRFNSLGIAVGQAVRVEAVMPLSGGMAVSASGVLLAMRKEGADIIFVRKRGVMQ